MVVKSGYRDGEELSSLKGKFDIKEMQKQEQEDCYLFLLHTVNV